MNHGGSVEIDESIYFTDERGDTWRQPLSRIDWVDTLERDKKTQLRWGKERSPIDDLPMPRLFRRRKHITAHRRMTVYDWRYPAISYKAKHTNEQLRTRRKLARPERASNRVTHETCGYGSDCQCPPPPFDEELRTTDEDYSTD